MAFEHSPITNMLNKAIFLKAQPTGLGGFEGTCVQRTEPERGLWHAEHVPCQRARLTLFRGWISLSCPDSLYFFISFFY